MRIHGSGNKTQSNSSGATETGGEEPSSSTPISTPASAFSSPISSSASRSASRGKPRKKKSRDQSLIPHAHGIKKGYNLFDRFKPRIWRNARILILVLLVFVFYHSLLRHNTAILLLRPRHALQENGFDFSKSDPERNHRHNAANSQSSTDDVALNTQSNQIPKAYKKNKSNRIGEPDPFREFDEDDDVTEVNHVNQSESLSEELVGTWSHGKAFKGSRNRMRLSKYSEKRNVSVIHVVPVKLAWHQSIGQSLFSNRKELRNSDEFFVCNKRDKRSDVCLMRGDVRMNAKTRIATLFAKESKTTKGVEKIQPYPRKWEISCMKKVRIVTLRSVDASKADDSDISDKTIPIPMKSHHELNGSKRDKDGIRIDLATDATNVSSMTSSEFKSQNRVLLVHNKKNRRTENPTVKDEACNVIHTVPAMLISLGGHTGNVYHDFNDGLIPLFTAIQHLKGEVLLVILQDKIWWWMKYESVVRKLSNYSPVILERSDSNVHCFPELAVGVKVHGELSINPALMPHRETIHDFQNIINSAWFGWETCSCRNRNTVKPSPSFVQDCRPQITLIARMDNRRIQNQDDLIRLANKLGFKVLTLYPIKTTNLQDIWADLRDSEVMIGVHGAAMTHFLFMRPGTSFIQIVPLGCKWSANAYYGEPAMNLSLEYIPYHVNVSESSLSRKYPPDHRALTKVDQMMTEDWSVIKKTYLDDQDVIVDLKRFESVLLKVKSMIVADKVRRKRIVKVFRKRKCKAKEWRDLFQKKPAM